MSYPLAFRMRPKDLSEVIGQQHLIAPGKIIWRMVQAQRLSSMILYGPPGTGKTSIAAAIAGSANYALRKVNAATDAKKKLEQVVAEAQLTGKVVLLLDEIHRLTKPKQDYLLPHLEDGKIILVGATTENPYIAINPAIRSRTQIFEVKPLSPNDIVTGLERALTDKERGLGNYQVNLSASAKDFFAQATNGDLRSALNALELAVTSTPADESGVINVDQTVAQECLQKRVLTADSDGDAHYDVISAFQKSIRGSDTDAALHYLARLIAAGDLPAIVRRLITIAYEDIGLANPQAAARTIQAVQAAERIGFPEARIPLATAVIDLCLSSKSNSAIRAIDAALTDVNNGAAGPIPDHLRDAHYTGAHKLGRGVNYLYPHDYPNDWVKQQYLPDNLVHKSYFRPKGIGRYETALKERYTKIKHAQEQSDTSNWIAN